jgi:hypothetical protein
MHNASENPGWYETPERSGRILREAKRDEATHRKTARDARSDQEQLDLLVARGHGQCREAVRLRAKIGGQS